MRARPLVNRPRAARLGALLLAATALLGGCGSSGDSYFARGSQRSSGRTDAEGREHGPWTYRYVDGQVRERGTWDHGAKVGTWTRWYSTGQRHSEGQRAWDEDARASLQEGVWTFWYSNGQLRAEGRFEAGLAVGPWRWWDHRGDVDRDRGGIYVDGRRTADLPD